MDAQGKHEFRFGEPCFGCFWHSEGFSGTPDGQFDQFSKKLDTHGEKKSASECSKAAHLQFCYKMRGICSARHGHKVDEMLARGARGANFAPVRSQKRRSSEASDHYRCEFYRRGN